MSIHKSPIGGMHPNIIDGTMLVFLGVVLVAFQRVGLAATLGERFAELSYNARPSDQMPRSESIRS